MSIILYYYEVGADCIVGSCIAWFAADHLAQHCGQLVELCDLHCV